MPITEATPEAPINPCGKANKMAEDIILDFSKTSDIAVTILRYFNVIGFDPKERLGEALQPELREQVRISDACFEAAWGIIPGLKVCDSLKIAEFYNSDSQLKLLKQSHTLVSRK